MNQSAGKARKSKNTGDVNKENKVAKASEKQVETVKPSEKSQAVPTPEQLRIAQIIDMRSEDPSLKDKLKKVMDATQTTADDAYTALHDCDNDVNRAVNLLLEGGTKDEWSTSSKKKKVRTFSEKIKDASAEISTHAEEEEDWGLNPVPSPLVGLRSAGRASRPRPHNKIGRGGRGSGPANPTILNNSVEKPDKTSNARPPKNRTANGPTGKGNKSFRGGRQGPRSRARGGGAIFRRPIESWDDTQPTDPIPALVDDSDNEEYTGSLANSQVFTASSAPKSKQGPPGIIQREHNQTQRTNLTAEPIGQSFTSSQILSHFALQQQLSLENKNANRETDAMNDRRIPNELKNMVPNALNLPSSGRQPGIASNSLPLTIRGRTVAVSSNASIAPPPGVVRSSLPKCDYSGNITSMNKADVFNVSRSKPGLPLLGFTRPEDSSLNARIMPRAKPRIPPPSKIPLTAVEMPPDGDSSIGRLDVQFGALDFVESSSDPIPNTPPSPQRSSPTPPPADNYAPPNSNQVNHTLISKDTRSFSPVPGTVPNALTTQLSDVGASKIQETTTTCLYQDTVYPSSLYAKSPQQNQGMYNSTFTTNQAFTSNSAIYSSSSTSHSSYSSTVGNYATNSYPPYQYPNYHSSHLSSNQHSASNHTTLQSSNNQYGIGSHSVYGSSPLMSSSYSMPYQTYNSSSQHKSNPASSSKEYESSTPNVNLSSITHAATISAASTLLSSTQTTPANKSTSVSTMNKGTIVTNMPPSVQPLVGTHQYIVGQGTMPYFQQPPVYYEDLQIMPQQRLPHHIPGYFEVGYQQQPSTTREYNLSDGRFTRTDTTSPVPSITQQSGSQGHQQQQLMNPTAIPPAYAYFYGGSVIPGNFPFSAPTIYPVAATGSTTGHGTTNTGTYGKGPTNYPGSYTGIYDNNQQNVEGYKSNSSQGPKAQQPTQSVNPSTSADIANIYSKSHSALSKSHDKHGFHCATPPPFNLSSQNSSLGPGGYPQHLYIPTMTPHNTTTLLHQPLHQEGANSVSGRSQVSSQQSKPNKNSYSSTYWTQN